jgi:hypothetical protein
VQTKNEFFDRLETMPALASLSADESRYLLLPPDQAEVGQIIRRPSREAGLSFEVDAARAVGLDDIIYQAAAAEKGALPLLSFLRSCLGRSPCRRLHRKNYTNPHIE